MTDLVKTIEDDEDVDGLSEDSASEDEFQPTRKRAKTGGSSGGVDPGFDFGQFSQDVWAEKMSKATSSKKKSLISSLDDKIKKRREANGKVEEIEIKEEDSSEEEAVSSDDEEVGVSDEIDSDNSISAYGPKAKKGKGKLKKAKKQITENDDIDLSDDELQEDKIILREREGKRKGKASKNAKISNEEDEEEEERQEVRLEDDPDYVFETDLSFQQMNLSRPLLKAITSLNFVHPTPIQAAAIKVALTGRDICGCAATGTGKTAAYMLPVLERLLYKPKIEAVTRVLCLVPTRELGVQVFQVTKNLASFSKDIQVGLAVGGLDIQQQEAILRQNPDIVIATPGRLIDHLGNTPSFNLAAIEILILDEADRMLDEWFAEQLKQIVKQCSPRRQTLLFSATMTDKVKDLATVSLKNPCRIFVDSNKQVAFNLRQQFVKIRNETDREAILCALIVRTFHSKTMVFVPTKKVAHRLHIILGLMNIRIGELHGDLTQIQRLDSLKQFQSGESDVLIVTDVAARGLDIPGVQSVINFAMPPTLEQYIHRCGRTARAGRSGVAVSLVGEQDRKLMKQVAKSATNPVKARVIPPEIIGKYRDKLKVLEPEIDGIMKEQEEDKAIVRAEIEANKAIKMIQDKKTKRKRKRGQEDKNENGRVWFQSPNERKDEQERLKGRSPAKFRKAIATAQEDMQIRKLVDFQKRQAKGKRKGRKPIDQQMEMNGGGPGGGKKPKRRSNFDDEITNVKGARAFRHQPKSFKEGDKRGPPGSKSDKGGEKRFSGGNADKSDQFKGAGGKGKGRGTPRGNENKSKKKFIQKVKRKTR